MTISVKSITINYTVKYKRRRVIIIKTMGKKKTISPSFHQLQKRIESGFTLIEILIVVGVLSVLGTVAVLLLDPATRLAASRDSNRFTSLQSVNQALSLIKIGNPSVSFGLGNTVYLSLPDSSPDCSSWDLPPLPETWSYACQTEANYRKVDGSGWTPVNLASSSLGTSSSVAPVDPRNNENNYFYYVYSPATNSYELGTAMETDKNKVVAQSDGGDNSDMWEIGSGLSLFPGASGFLAVTNDTSDPVRNENNFLSYASAASAGQVAFFIGSSQITGTNDLFWNDSTKRLGIGTALPGQKLTVAGTIESTAGGVKFPDGTTQTTAFTSPLSVAGGGTGATTLTGLLTGNGTGAFTILAPGTSGNVLTSNGTSWASAAPPAGSQMNTGVTTGTALDYTASAVTVINHNLGVIPRIIRVTTMRANVSNNNAASLSIGVALINTSNGSIISQNVSSLGGSEWTSSGDFQGGGIAGLSAATNATLAGTLSGVTSTQMVITFPGTGFGTLIPTTGAITFQWEVIR